MKLRAAGEPKKLSRKARARITDTSNDLVFSAASIWEVAIKAALGRADFLVDPVVAQYGASIDLL